MTKQRVAVSAILVGLLVVPERALVQRPAGVPSEWPLYGGSLANQRYSTLAQITSTNVKSLGGAWMTRLPGPTVQSAVTMANGLVFAVSTNRWVSALDAKTGQIRWKYELTSAPSRRGLAINGDAGLVFAIQEGSNEDPNDGGQITAIHTESGKLAWTRTFAPDPASGRKAMVTSAPVYANGVVLVSISGGDSGRRGGVIALDGTTGAENWRFYAVPGPGEKGFETWPDNDMWKAGGGAVWSPAAVDPELGMVYFGTGNPNGNPKGLEGQHPTNHPGLHPSHTGDPRPGDQLFTASVVALDLKTGAYRWHFQLTRHDIWDMDVANPMVLYDTTVEGRSRKGIAVLRTDGYLFLLDRVDGSPLLPIEERPVEQDPFQFTAATQPFPVGAERVVPDCVEPDLMPPGFKAACYFTPLNQPNLMVPYIGTRQSPMAYHPQTGYFYITAGVWPWWATRYGGSFTEPGGRRYGSITAVDSRTNKIVWQKRAPYPLAWGGGMLATAGNLVFHGEPDGNVQAHDAKTGDLLWQFQTGFGADAPVITYAVDGEQYIALAPSGSHPGLGAPVSRADVVWAFKLGGKVNPSSPPAPPPLVQPFTGAVAKRNEIAIDFTERNKNPDKMPGAQIDDYETFQPRRVQVSAGTEVTWKNTGHAPHTISVRGQQNWTTGPVAPSATGAIRFDRPGTYVFTCENHPWQQGEITVVR